jgi:sec-independent protein translocase protein TatB
MLDFDLGKLLLIGVVALIFIPPKDLPQALRTLGKLISQARRMASDFQGQFSEALRESELDGIKQQFADLKQSTSLEGALERMAEAVEPKADAPNPEPPVNWGEAALAAQAQTAPAIEAQAAGPAPETVVPSILPPAPETAEKAPEPTEKA